MDPIMATIVIKGLGMVLLIFGGIAQIYVGYKVYKDGLNLNSDKATLQYGKLRMQANSVGTLVMGTAALWAVTAVAITPSIKTDGERVQVASLDISGAKIQVPTLIAPLSKENNENVLKDSKQLKTLFAEAVRQNSSESNRLNTPTINKKPAQFDLGSVITERPKSGDIVIFSDLKAGSTYGHVAYVAEVKDKDVIFVPTGIGSRRSSDNDLHQSHGGDKGQPMTQDSQ